jgi:hypothetical protein
MNSNFLEIDGKYYSINMDKVIEFITEGESSTQTISQNYGLPIDDEGKVSPDIKLISKDVSETKESVNENLSNLRYSILTYFLNILMTPLSDGAGNIILNESMKTLHFGQVLAFNTLYEMEIIYEIESEE